ncbi:MAG: hypothetical protein AB1782_00035 [Cyanobacteriota bacterium]
MKEKTVIIFLIIQLSVGFFYALNYLNPNFQPNTNIITENAGLCG